MERFWSCLHFQSRLSEVCRKGRGSVSPTNVLRQKGWIVQNNPNMVSFACSWRKFVWGT